MNEDKKILDKVNRNSGMTVPENYFADFAENYKACVEKRPYKPFGVPNADECMKNAYYKTPMI